MRTKQGTAEVRGVMGLERDGTEICVEVSGVYVKYVPGSYYDPPEGGFVEDIQAENSETGEEVTLTEAEEEEAAEMLAVDYDPEGDCDE